MALTLDGTSGIVSSGAISSSSNITATGSITTQSSTGIIFSDSSNQGAAASPFSLKNRIINGDMVIDQRNNGATTSTTNGYTLDRFYFYSDISGISTTVQRVSDAPTGFVNSLRVTAVTGATAGAGRQSVIGQSIEGFNVADLGWGTANARTITISFWVKSSLTGTFAGNLQNAAPNRDYVFTYTISAANTWEYKTVTISGDTTGTWGTTNGVGISVYFNMGSNQSSFAGTANTWSPSIFRTVTGATELLQTTGATWQITGVQLERNTTATPFEWLPYSTELALCQRYCYRVTNTGNTPPFASGVWQTSTLTASFAKLPITMRATPTISFSAIGDIQYLDRDLAWRPGTSSLVINEAGPDGVNIGCVCSTGSIAGYGTIVEVRGTNGWFQFNAEL